MRKRWKVGVLAIGVLALAGLRAATLAQKPAKTWGVVSPIPDGPRPDGIPTKTPADSQWAYTNQSPTRAGSDALPGNLPAANSRTADPVLDDPMGAVDSFLQRSRKEADESIKALTQEAEALRARLQNVEAALGRWQAVAGALNQDGKLRWRGPEPETAPQPEPSGTPKDVPTLSPVAEPPPALPAELPPPTTRPSADSSLVPAPEAVSLPSTVPQPK